MSNHELYLFDSVPTLAPSVDTNERLCADRHLVALSADSNVNYSLHLAAQPVDSTERCSGGRSAWPISETHCSV